MRGLPSEVQPAVDLAALRTRWDALEAREAKTLGEIRLEKGRLLVEARKAFPRSGPKAAGWGALLMEWRIGDDTALNYMKLAGYVAEKDPPKTSGEPARVPTYAEAGIARPAPQSQPDPIRAPVVSPPEPRGYQEVAFSIPEPAPISRPPHAWTDEDREAEQRHHIARIQPPKMETREERTRRLSLAWNDAAATIQRIREEAQIHLTDATTSPDDFESVKKTIVSVARAALDELETAGALDAPEPRKRQLSILDGGKP